MVQNPHLPRLCGAARTLVGIGIGVGIGLRTPSVTGA